MYSITGNTTCDFDAAFLNYQDSHSRIRKRGVFLAWLPFNQRAGPDRDLNVVCSGNPPGSRNYKEELMLTGTVFGQRGSVFEDGGVNSDSFQLSLVQNHRH